MKDGKRSLHKFEPRQARFFPHVGHIKPGAYKSVAFGMTVYFFMDADEIMYRGPVEIIKVLGARLEGVSYFGYDVSKVGAKLSSRMISLDHKEDTCSAFRTNAIQRGE